MCRFFDFLKLVSWLRFFLVFIIFFVYNFSIVFSVLVVVVLILLGCWYFEGNYYLFVFVVLEEIRRYIYIFFFRKEVLKLNLVKIIEENLNKIFIFF